MKSNMEWTRERTLSLIQEYKKRPGLWDMTHEDYRKKDIKKELLDQVVQVFDGVFPQVEIEKKFHTLRTQYHREINRMNQVRSNNEPYKSKWFAFKHLLFLSSPNACRSGRSSMIKVKIEKSESNASTTAEEDDEEPAAKYVIKSVPVHTYTTTTIPSHAIQTEFITTTSHNNKNNSCATEIEVDPLPSRSARVKEMHRITRKELETLIEDATKNVEEQETEERMIIKEVNVPVQAVHGYNQATVTDLTRIHTGTNSYEAQQQTDEIDGTQHITEAGTIVQAVQTSNIEDNSYSQAYQNVQSQTKTPPIRSNSNSQHQQKQQRNDSQMYEEIVYEDHQQSSSTPVKKVFYEKMPVRDEFTIFGEYVANELRFITNRDLLVTAKHKINIALFEASTNELSRFE